MYALIKDGTIVAFPYGAAQLMRDNPQVSFPQPMSDKVLASFGVLPVTDDAPPAVNPATHRPAILAPVQEAGQWVRHYQLVPLTAEETQAYYADLKNSISAAAQARLDAFARTRDYDGILSVCSYAGSAIPRFRDDGLYCAGVRDATWAALYAIMAEVEAGTRPVPAGFADIEADLPALAWPA